MRFYVYDIKAESLPTIAQSEQLRKIFTYRRLEKDGTEEADPKKADYFIVPTLFLLDEFNRLDNPDFLMESFVKSLPYFKGNEAQHVFLDQSDDCVKPRGLAESIVFTVTPKATDPLHRALPFYPYRHEWLDAARLLKKPFGDSKFDLFFKGCGDNMPIRKTMLDNVKVYERHGFACYVQSYSRYFWSHDNSDKQKEDERRHYFERLTDAKFILCPRGRGTTSSRFFEAMYFGRIPVLISDDYRLPLETTVDWDNLIVRASPEDIPRLHEKIYGFVKTHKLAEVSEELKRISHTYFVKEALFKLVKETLDVSKATK